eukprot:3702366-Rhodomonas_salina.1
MGYQTRIALFLASDCGKLHQVPVVLRACYALSGTDMRVCRPQIVFLFMWVSYPPNSRVKSPNSRVKSPNSR